MTKKAQFTSSLAVLAAALMISGAARASMEVYGGTNFSRSDGTHPSDDYVPTPHPWSANLAVGAGLSQLISDSQPSEVLDSHAQMMLSGGLERRLIGPISAEGDMALGLQVLSYGPASSMVFSARYLDFPMQARLYFSREFSLGAGGFLTVPIDNLDGAPANMKLGAADLGLAASARYNIPAGRQLDWVIQLGIEKGFVHLGDAGASPSHLRNVASLIGMSARF